MSALVVANKTLPCGTELQITFTRRAPNGHKKTYSSYAYVEDRGPYVAGRDLDLGPAVARAVHFDGLGTVRWRVVG